MEKKKGVRPVPKFKRNAPPRETLKNYNKMIRDEYYTQMAFEEFMGHYLETLQLRDGGKRNKDTKQFRELLADFGSKVFAHAFSIGADHALRTHGIEPIQGPIGAKRQSGEMGPFRTTPYSLKYDKGRDKWIKHYSPNFPSRRNKQSKRSKG